MNNGRIKIFFMSLFFIAPVFSMDNHPAQDHDMLFLWYTLCQGNFVINLPMELRKAIWECASKDHMLLCHSLMKKTIYLDLSLSELMRYNQRTLDGIGIIDAGCVSKVYDLNYNVKVSTSLISREEYEKARKVPRNIKRMFAEKKPVNRICAFKTIPFLIGEEDSASKKVILSLR